MHGRGTPEIFLNQPVSLEVRHITFSMLIKYVKENTIKTRYAKIIDVTTALLIIHKVPY